ncbi:hypothetical protein HanPSC8_Chr13g0562781 [Helianthus annuus]|nr:hypothetical protein HanPSC8_Chr13g0562781 [Helianthus annuus]
MLSEGALELGSTQLYEMWMSCFILAYCLFYLFAEDDFASMRFIVAAQHATSCTLNDLKKSLDAFNF